MSDYIHYVILIKLIYLSNRSGKYYLPPSDYATLTSSSSLKGKQEQPETKPFQSVYKIKFAKIGKQYNSIDLMSATCRQEKTKKNLICYRD